MLTRFYPKNIDVFLDGGLQRDVVRFEDALGKLWRLRRDKRGQLVRGKDGYQMELVAGIVTWKERKSPAAANEGPGGADRRG